MPTPTLTFARVTRDGDTVTVRTKLPDVDPASVHARVVDGELIVTAQNRPRGTSALPVPERHRLIDLGPKLRTTIAAQGS